MGNYLDWSIDSGPLSELFCQHLLLDRLIDSEFYFTEQKIPIKLLQQISNGSIAKKRAEICSGCSPIKQRQYGCVTGQFWKEHRLSRFKRTPICNDLLFSVMRLVSVDIAKLDAFLIPLRVLPGEIFSGNSGH